MADTKARFSAILRAWIAHANKHAEHLATVLPTLDEDGPPARQEKARRELAEKLARHAVARLDATPERIEALAGTLTNDAEKMGRALYQERWPAVREALALNRWPIRAHPAGEHGWFNELAGAGSSAWMGGSPGSTTSVLSWPDGLVDTLCDAADAPDETRAKLADRPLWGLLAIGGPQPLAWPDGNYFGAETLPPESTRPWWPLVGAALAWEAERRAYPELAARETLTALAGDPGGPHHGAAAWAIENAGDENEDASRRALAGELAERIPGLLDAVGFDAPPEGQVEDGMLWADCRAVDFIGHIGDEGAKVATALRDEARKRWTAYQQTATPSPEDKRALWRLWLEHYRETNGTGVAGGLVIEHEGAPPVLRALAAALWVAAVKPKLEREEKRKRQWERFPAPVLATAVVEHVHSIRAPGGETRIVGPGAELVDADAALAPMWRTAVTHEEIARHVRALRHPVAERAWRFVIWRGQEEWDGSEKTYTITIVGGKPALRKAIGSKSNKDDGILDTVLDAWDNLRIPIPGLYTGRVWLLAVDDIPPAPGRQSVLRVTLNTPLLSYFWRRIKGRDKDLSIARRLQPVLRPGETPPPVIAPGKTRAYPGDYGPLCLLQGLVVRDMSERAVEMVTEGGVLIPDERWCDLGREAGVRKTLLDDPTRIPKSWTTPGTENLFPCLVQAGKDRYRLAYEDAQKCIESLGEYRKEQSRKASKPRKKKP